MDEDLKNRFIVDENPDDKKIEGYVKRIMPYCKTTKKGAIIFVNEDIKSLDKVKASLVVRYLANHAEPAIPSEIMADEFESLLDIPKTQVYARLKDVRDEKFVTVSEKGGYRVKPHEIAKFLDKLDEKYGKIQT